MAAIARSPWPRRLLVSLAIFCLGLAEAPLLVEDPLLTRDDRSLLKPLETISTPADYVALVRSGALLDVQPVRDLTFLGNLWLKAHLGHGLFHATNLALWWLSCLLLARLLATLDDGGWRSAGAAALVALHPALVMSVCWVAARKHLLALLFTLLATLAFQRLLRSGRWSDVAATLFAFLLAVFSQPIGVTWPLWAVLVARVHWRRGPVITCLGLLGAAALCVAAINYGYYAHRYVEDTGHQKFVDGFSPGVSALALGRAAFNLACPVVLATVYSPGSAVNLAGLFVLVLFGLAVRLWVAPREAFSWGLFAVLPLGVVLGKITSAFLFDSYLLQPAVGVAALGVLLSAPLADAGRRTGALASALALAAGAAFLAEDVSVARTWRSDKALWQHAWEVEPTPRALGRKAHYLAGTEQDTEAIEAALSLRELQPDDTEWPGLLARAVLRHRSLEVSRRLALLDLVPSADAWGLYARGGTWARQCAWREATTWMQRALRTPSAFGADLPLVAAEATWLCRRSGSEECAQAQTPLEGNPDWSPERYQTRLGQLEASSPRCPAESP